MGICLPRTAGSLCNTARVRLCRGSGWGSEVLGRRAGDSTNRSRKLSRGAEAQQQLRWGIWGRLGASSKGVRMPAVGDE